MSINEEYINIDIKAVGYVTKIITRRDSRKELVKIRMNLLSGKKSAMKYVGAEFFVIGSAAIKLIKKLEETFTEGDPVLLSFIGNGYPSHFVSQAAGREGEVVNTLSGSVTSIKSIKKDGVWIYREGEDKTE